METMSVEKQEKRVAKKQAKVDWEFVESVKRSLEDVKAGRIKRVR